MRSYLTAAVAAAIICAPVAANAQSDIPNLEGLWQCETAPTLLRDGEWSTLDRQVDVTEQRGALFRATQSWSLDPDDNVTGHADGQRIASGSIPLVGVIDYDNRTFVAGAFGDGHITHGQLVDDNTLRFATVETGDHAWASRTTCHRDAEG